MTSDNRQRQKKTMKKSRRMSYSLRMSLLLLALLPTTIMLLITALSQSARERAIATEQMSERADLSLTEIDSWLEAGKHNLRAIAANPVLGSLTIRLLENNIDVVARYDFTSNTRTVTEVGQFFDKITLLTPDGKVLSSSDPDTKALVTSFANEPWVDVAMQSIPTGSIETAEIFVSGPYRDPIDDQESFFFTMPLYYGDSELVSAVLLGRVSLDNFKARIEQIIPESTLGETGEYYIVRSGQQYVIPPHTSPDATLATGSVVDIALSKQNGSDVWQDYQGHRVIGTYRWVEPLDFSLVIKQDMLEVLAANRRMLFQNIAVIFVIMVLAVVVSIFISRRTVKPLQDLSETATRISEGNLTLQAPGSQITEVDHLSSALNNVTQQLQRMIRSQEATIQARTRQLEITSKIGSTIAAETSLDRVLQLTTEMIRDQLEHYHAQVFMLDDLRQYAVLKTSVGKAGQKLLARGHKLPVGSQSVVGQATSRGVPILASDTRHADYWLPNPLLPDTRAEVAVPVRLGNEIIGAIDVQDTRPDVFDEPTIDALQTIADQLAVAIRNAQLFEEKESLLAASLQLTQTLTDDRWGTYASQRSRSNKDLGFSYDLSAIQPVQGKDGEIGNRRGVQLPIALRGTVIGELMTELPDGEELSEEQQQLVGAVLERVALALENARLFEQTQLSLAEINRLFQASQKIAGAETVQELLDDLVELSMSDVVDRIFVLLLETPTDPPGERWVEVVARWLRDPDDRPGALADRLHTGQPPLLGIEDVPPIGMVFNDSSQAGLSRESREIDAEMGITSKAIFPMNIGRRTIGWLLIHSTQEQQVFTESDERFYATIADQVATAFESLRLFEQTQVRARRLQATNEVSRAASSILNPDILLPLIVDRISEAFDYYHVQIFLIDDYGEWAVLRASTGEVGQELLRRQHKLAVGSQSVIGQVTILGEPVIARNTDTDPVHRRNELLPNTLAEMAIPLRIGDRAVGALDVQSTQINAFDAEAQVILQSLADEIAVTLENAQLFQEIQDRVAELTTVNLVSQAVSRAETLVDLYDVVATQLVRTFGTRHGFLGIINNNVIELPIFVEDGQRIEPPAPIELGEGLMSHVIKSRRILMINENLEEEAERLGARLVGAMPRSLLAAPLQLGDEVIGVISIQDAEREKAYSDAHVRQLTTLAAYIAVKIRNAELLEQAQRRAGELGFLFNVTRAAVATTDLDEALTNVAQILRYEIPNVETSMVYLFDETGRYLEPHAAIGYGRESTARMDKIEVGTGLVGMVAGQRQSTIIQDARLAPYFAPGEERTRSALMVPLQTGRQMIGLLTVENTRANAFDEPQLRLLETASGALTAVIQNAQLLEEITEANERLQELDKLKSQFLANMSHELRTPLNSIIGFSRVMIKGIDGPLNDLQNQDLTTIYNSGQHLLGLINDILDLSKIEARMMEIQPEYTAMNEIIDGVTSSGRGLVKDKPIAIYKEVEDNLPQVYGDPVRLRQVLLNLVSNAAKFTHEGSITIRAGRREYNPETGEPPRVQIDVIDTGIGVPDDKLDSIFEPFQQVDGSTTRQYGGTGLGLPISSNFIELHGGRMWATSEAGVGSTFSFTIPLHPPEESTGEFEGLDEEDTRPVVLAIDDEPGVLELYERYLEDEYNIVGLDGARDLLGHISQVGPAAIMLDLNMPEKNGWQALEEIRRHEDTRNIPVIICSIEEEQQRAREAGADAYLVKPVLEDDLLSVLERLLQDGIQQRPPQVNVLIIDGDEEMVQAVIRALNQTAGYTANVASAGYEALQRIQEDPPDAILMDLDLPDMDGYGLLVAMNSHQDTTGIPVLVMADRSLSDSELERLNHPYLAYLNKSEYTPQALLEGLSAVLSRRAAVK